MALSSGERLGPYEIIGQLGAGSMGVVYRARDTRLGRDVAVKVLTDALAADGDLVRRFEVEARAAGVLSHPNIVAIHDVGEHAKQPYLVSELLEGQSLRDELEPGKPLPPRKAIEYGLQIALGLAAAHEKGIVHRDLKPENLFVTRDGRLKILDFGLAKLIDPVGGPAHSASTIRNLNLGGTTPGTVLGTVGYMSPEQVRGLAADHRADIFAVGAILYEMLAGKRAFDGQSGVDVMAAILSDAPAPLPRTVPGGLERAVKRCLEKEPAERFQSARDLAFQLEALGHHTPTQAMPAVPPQKRALQAGAIVAIVVATAAAFFFGRRAGAPAQPAYHQLTFRRGTVSAARFAPDGRGAVYAGAWQGSAPQVFVTDPRSPESRRLELPPADLLAVSSKGEMALLLRRHLTDGEPAGTLAQASMSGGPPRELLEEVEAADWSPDGAQLLVVRRVQGKSQLEYPQGKVLYATDGAIEGPRISRDGARVAFVDRPRRGDDSGSIALVENGKVRKLSGPWAVARGLAWSPGGEVWFTAADPGSAPALRAVTTGGVERVVTRVTGRLTLHDISPQGQVLLARESGRAGLLVAPDGGEEKDLAWFDGSLLTDLSDDGKAVIFVESGGEAASHAVFSRKTDGSPAVRLGDGLVGKLSPDGKSVLVLPTGGGAQLLPTGAGDAVSLPFAGVELSWASFFPDGKQMLLLGRERGHGAQFFAAAIASPETLHPLTPEGMPLAPAAASRDGKRIAALDPQQRTVVFEDGKVAAIDGAEKGEAPIRFSDDGRALYLFRPGDLPARIRRCTLASGRCEAVRELMPKDPAGIAGILAAFVTADGRGYAYGYRRVLSDLYEVDGLR